MQINFDVQVKKHQAITPCCHIFVHSITKIQLSPVFPLDSYIIYMYPLEAGQRPIMLLAGWILSTTPTRLVIPVQGLCLLRLWGLSDQSPTPPHHVNISNCLLKIGYFGLQSESDFNQTVKDQTTKQTFR